MTIVHAPSMNIVRCDHDIICNLTNAVGVMGKGVALAFRTEFPDIVAPYAAACRDGTIREGTANLYPLRGHQMWCALTTKRHWRDASRIEWVERALEALAGNATAAGARTIALPPPGCGLGGLDYEDVAPLVARHLAGFEVTVTARPPRGGRRGRIQDRNGWTGGQSR